jgi:hypothetical protein
MGSSGRIVIHFSSDNSSSVACALELEVVFHYALQFVFEQDQVYCDVSTVGGGLPPVVEGASFAFVRNSSHHLLLPSAGLPFPLSSAERSTFLLLVSLVALPLCWVSERQPSRSSLL